MYIINKLWDCGRFQGTNKKSHYFEGWYFKNVDAEAKNIISIIPGISFEDQADKSHAFIQVIEGSNHNTHYIRYKAEEFSFSKERFEIKIADNIFGNEGIELNIESDDLKLQGKLCYSNHIVWGSSLKAPNSMGWYAYIPYMECYHGVLSMGHGIQGELKMNGEQISFQNGVGYMEKDWGTSFPSSWIWLQSNHFVQDHAAIMLSVANIPWHKKSFLGFIAGIWCNDRLYKFTTYTGAKIDYLEYRDGGLRIKISDKRYALILEGEQGNTGALISPTKGVMTGEVQESVRAVVRVTLYDYKSNRQIFNNDACPCGMELANVHGLLSQG